MRFAWMCARHESVQAFYPVHEPMHGEKIERSVSDGWLRTKSRLTQQIEDFIGPKRPMFPKQ